MDKNIIGAKKYSLIDNLASHDGVAQECHIEMKMWFHRMWFLLKSMKTNVARSAGIFLF